MVREKDEDGDDEGNAHAAFCGNKDGEEEDREKDNSDEDGDEDGDNDSEEEGNGAGGEIISGEDETFCDDGREDDAADAVAALLVMDADTDGDCRTPDGGTAETEIPGSGAEGSSAPPAGSVAESSPSTMASSMPPGPSPPAASIPKAL